jgi:calcineurin-like phosphoesterase family protein
MIWFTGDEHYFHKNIIKYTNRPFGSMEEMDDILIKNFNNVVQEKDIVYHLGDFIFNNKYKEEYIKSLNGINIFLKGNHDKHMGNLPYIVEITIDGQFIVLCHYAMRVWNRSHYGSWQLYGHSHGTLPPIGNQYDVGVDNNEYFPISFEQLKVKIIQNNT